MKNRRVNGTAVMIQQTKGNSVRYCFNARTDLPNLECFWEEWHVSSHGGKQELAKGMGVPGECMNHCK